MLAARWSRAREAARLLGVDDPRCSGLGNWRDEPGSSFDEVGDRLADAACDAARTASASSTVLVHDANLGRQALDRGCVDLVVGGHLHVQVGPDAVVGENGAAGYTLHDGTTGGAAYAIAVGSKLRRDAEVTLVTYRDGRPVGIQPVPCAPTARQAASPSATTPTWPRSRPRSSRTFGGSAAGQASGVMAAGAEVIASSGFA